MRPRRLSVRGVGGGRVVLATLALVLVLVWMRWSPPPDEDVDGAWRGLLLANATGVRLALHFHVALNDDALSLRRAAACVHDADVALRDAHEDDGLSLIHI